MRSRTPLPQRQQAHWGAFLEAAALFLALCVLGLSLIHISEPTRP